MLNKRVEILFEPEQYRRLEEIARSRKSSIGALIRQAVEREYLGPALAQRRAAVERIIAQEIGFGSWETVKDEIGQAVTGFLETR